MLPRESNCEVCGGPLCGHGRAITGVCGDCRRAGARFMRSWAAELAAAGAVPKEIAVVLDTTPATVRARLRERRLAGVR